MDKKQCKNCIHFYQHYILDEQRCTAVNCGHCSYPRPKHRKPENRGCDHYQERTQPPGLPDRKAVIDFLTTDLLRYILSLELPPEEISGGNF